MLTKTSLEHYSLCLSESSEIHFERLSQTKYIIDIELRDAGIKLISRNFLHIVSIDMALQSLCDVNSSSLISFYQNRMFFRGQDLFFLH